MCVVFAVSTDPDITVLVERETVIRLGPLVALARTTPGANEVPGRIEFENRWSWLTTLSRVATGCRRFSCRDRTGSVNNEHVVTCVDRDANRHTHHPVVGKWLRPQRVDDEHRCFHTTLRLRWAASEKRLYAEYDPDGPANGDNWSILQNYDLANGATNWNLNPTTGSFMILLYAGSENRTVTTADNLWFDNFKINGGNQTSPPPGHNRHRGGLNSSNL